MPKIHLFFTFLLTISFLFGQNFAQEENSMSPTLPFVTDISIKRKGSLPEKFPHYYRKAQDFKEIESQSLPLDGLQNLAIAGTSQFTFSQLAAIVEDLNTPVLVVDLRQETHFLMEDTQGIEFSISPFFSQNLSNVGKTIEEIALDHAVYKAYLMQEGVVSLHYTKNGEVQYEEDDVTYEISSLYTEKEAIALLHDLYSSKISYLHMPFIDHHIPPVDVIDTFIQLFRKFEEGNIGTMLFHCRAGRGRTGQLMVMSDMLANARTYHLSCDEIIQRQAALGSPDFSAVDPMKIEQSLERYMFLQNFYTYATSDNGYISGIDYSTWLER